MASTSTTADRHAHVERRSRSESYESGIPGLEFESYDNALLAKVLWHLMTMSLGAFVAAYLVHALGRWLGLV